MTPSELELKIKADVHDASVGLEILGKKLEVTRTAVTRMNTSFANSTKGINSASVALVNVGRVAQDLPFGFIGIANNLNPLFESFQRLRNETGSTSLALKALGSSLLGGGGLGLALSGITSALTLAQVGFSAWTRGFGGATEKLEEHARTVEVVKSEHEKFAESMNKVVENAAKESTEVSLIFSALVNSNISLSERATLIGKLNEISPPYLGSLDKEKASYEEIAKAIQVYNESQVNVIRIKALLPEAEKIFKKILDAQIELAKNKELQGSLFGLSEEDFNKEQRRLTDFIRGRTAELSNAKKYLTELAGGEDILGQILFGKTDTTEVKKTSDTIAKALDDLQKQIRVLDTFEINLNVDKGTDKLKAFEEALKQINGISDSVTNKLSAVQTVTAQIEFVEGNPAEKIKAIETAIQQLLNLKIDPQDTIIQKLFGDIDAINFDIVGKELQQKFGTIQDFKLPDIAAPVDIRLLPEIDVPKTLKDINKEISEAQKRIALGTSKTKLFTAQGIEATSVSFLNSEEVDENFKNLQDRIQKTAELASNILAPAFTAAFEAIANGQNVFESVGNSIRQLVVRLAAAAAEAAILSVILNVLLPGSTQVPGFGALFSQLAGLPKFADGGIVNSPIIGLIGERGREVVMPLNRLNEFINTDGGSMHLTGEFRLRGTDLLASVSRAQKHNLRTNGKHGLRSD